MVANYRSGAWSGFSYGTPADNEAFGLMVAGDGRLAVQGWGNENDYVSTTAGRGEGWLTQSVIYQGGTTFHYRDGSLIDSDTHVYNTQNDRLRLGVELDDNRHIEMDVAELLVYKRAISENQRVAGRSLSSRKVLLAGAAVRILHRLRLTISTRSMRALKLHTADQGLPGVLDNDSDADGDSLSTVLVAGAFQWIVDTSTKRRHHLPTRWWKRHTRFFHLSGV